MLLSQGSKNAKLAKSTKYGWTAYGLSLAPHTMSGYNVCPNSSEGCRNTCLAYQGYARIYKHINESRAKKTRQFFEHRTQFLAKLSKELERVQGKKVCIRLNVFSDIPWENYLDLSHYNIQFYDYTKSYKRMMKFLQGKFPHNYHLTFSRSEDNEHLCKKILDNEGNVAIVFDAVPETWNGYPVHNGDESDLRFLDDFGVIGLKAKGTARKDESNFVYRIGGIVLQQNNPDWFDDDYTNDDDLQHYYRNYDDIVDDYLENYASYDEYCDYDDYYDKQYDDYFDNELEW